MTNTIGFSKIAYVVTYQKVAHNLHELLTGKDAIPTPSDTETYYFGNTKGNNQMQDCNRMFMLGWNTLPDYEYVIQWLSICVGWDKVVKGVPNFEQAVLLSQKLEVKDRSRSEFAHDQYGSRYKTYEFGFEALNQYKYFSMVTDFYQEVHRTKLRNYSCNEEIEVHIFSVKEIVLKMIEQLFPKKHGYLLNAVNDDLIEFKESKSDNRKNKGIAYTKFKAWLDTQIKGRGVTTKELLLESELDSKRLNKLRESNTFVGDWFKEHTVSRGKYIV